MRIHDAVRRRIRHLPEDHASSVGTNRRGHRQHLFDLSADKAVLEELQSCFTNALVLSEESELRHLGEGSPQWRFVIDPVDGSDNHARGLPLSAVSIAVLDPEGPLALDRVRWAMVGGLDEDQPHVAARDRGCQRGDKPVSVSGMRILRDAFLSCELNHSAPTRRLSVVFSQARAVRSYGCASRALMLVACGALDAHIDVRNRLTAESFLAAAFMVEEAGGCVLDLDGNNFQHLTDLRSTVRMVAAATPELAHQIAKEINEI
ncbi:MAG: hypothetical protein KAY32_06660 [Candidatus Eisenbacteria sp.]|nr:hypothetical protein [Candidatus Eisenbacteria bacterium]